MVPFRSIRERGFAAVGDEPVLVMEVDVEERCAPGGNDIMFFSSASLARYHTGYGPSSKSSIFVKN